MSIFSKIKDAIFGKKAVAAPAPVQTAAPVAEVVAPVSAPAAIIEEVDVEAIMEGLAEANPAHQIGGFQLLIQ